MARLENTANIAVEVFAADGDSVILPGKSTHNVDDKFLWNLPRKVRQIKPVTVPVTPVAPAPAVVAIAAEPVAEVAISETVEEAPVAPSYSKNKR